MLAPQPLRRCFNTLTLACQLSKKNALPVPLQTQVFDPPGWAQVGPGAIPDFSRNGGVVFASFVKKLVREGFQEGQKSLQKCLPE